MLARITGWIMKSKIKIAKIGGGILGGSGILSLILFLHTSLTGRIDNVEASGKEYTKEYVDLSLEPYKVEMINLKKDVGDTKTMVRDIHNYLLETKTK